MGFKVMGDLLFSGHLDVRRSNQYSEYVQRAPHQVSFFLAYTQADLKSEIFMKIPICFVVEGAQPREWFIKLDKNLCGLKDAGLEWFEKLKEVLEARGFFQSQVDPFIWYK